MTNRPAVASVTLVAVALTLAACSQDRHVFRSTVFSPKTVEVRDMVSRRVIWTKDVPVGYQLVMDFDTPYEMAPYRIGTNPPTELTWYIARSESDVPRKIEKGKLRLPGVNVIIDVTLRPVPEYPPGYSPGPPEGEAEPTPPPATAVPLPPLETIPEPQPEPPAAPAEEIPEPQPETPSDSSAPVEQDDQPAPTDDSQPTDTTEPQDSTEPVDPALEEVLDDSVGK